MKQHLKILKYLATYLYNILFRTDVYSYYVSIYAKIGKDTSLMQGVRLDKYSSIGNYTYIAQGVLITKSQIGNYCSIAPSAKIGLGEHILSRVSTSPRFYTNSYEELTKGECKIDNDVWIGANAVILRGVHIGHGAVIGANAVVTKDIPPFAIAVGMPAKIIKYRFSPEIIQKIINSNWWSYSYNEAKLIIKSLENE